MENSTRDKKRGLFVEDSDSYPVKRKFFFRNRDWSKMPDDMVRLITGKLLFSAHHCRLAAACRDWYRIAREFPCLYQENTPFMLIPHNDEIEKGKCSLYQVSDSKTFVFDIPDLRGKFVHGSSKGWLIVANDDFELSLLNILTRKQIALPEPSYALDVLEDMIELDNMLDPYTRGCFVAAIMSFYDKAFICRLGDESWTQIQLKKCDPKKYPHICGLQEDIIFFGGKLYVGCNRNITIVDLDGPDFEARTMRVPKRRHDDQLENLRVYLVEWSGSLLYVRKFGEMTNISEVGHHKTHGFEVYKLEKDAVTWSVVERLGEYALFLGNESWTVSSGEVAWCRPNCIYYADDVWGGQQVKGDNGVFSIEDGSIHMFNISRRVSSCMWYQHKRS